MPPRIRPLPQRSRIRLHQRHRRLPPNLRMSSLLRRNQLQPSRLRSQLSRKRPHLHQVFLINRRWSSCLNRLRLRSLNPLRLRLPPRRHQLHRHQLTLHPQLRRRPRPRTQRKQLQPLRVRIRLHSLPSPRRPQPVRPRPNRQRPHQLQRSAPRTYGAAGSGPFPALTLPLALNSSAAMLLTA
jgi:hypothetical protein